MGFPGGTSGKELTAKAGDLRDASLIPRLGKSLGERNKRIPRQRNHGQRRLTVHGGRTESDMTEVT